MTLRDKGPRVTHTPFDQDAELRDASNYSHRAWQLRAIEVQ